MQNTATAYRLYLLDRRGQVSAATVLNCCNDSEAIALARTRTVGERAELWDRDRKVATLPADAA